MLGYKLIEQPKVRQFYKQYIQRGGPGRRKLILSIGPDPTLNTVEEEGGEVWSWAERAGLRTRCRSLHSLQPATLRSWLDTVFRCELDGYQPPGENLSCSELAAPAQHTVTFSCPETQQSPVFCPEMDRT